MDNNPIEPTGPINQVPTDPPVAPESTPSVPDQTNPITTTVTPPATPVNQPELPQAEQPPIASSSSTEPIYTTNNEPKPEKHGNGIVSFVATIVIALVLTQIINLFFFQSYRVFGSSMYGTLHDGDRLIVSKVSRTVSKIKKTPFQPERGQIIIFTSPKDPTLQLVKRVIGLPGERVVVKDGKITVYNNEHPEGFNPDDADYGKNLPETSGEADVTVPENNIFVSGDNRVGSNSYDSRDGLGTVPEDLIIGKVSVRLWPIQSARFF